MKRIYRATIIRKDKFISLITDEIKESIYIREELTWLPKNIHAIQWYGSEGTIEYTDDYEKTIYSIEPYYQYMIDSIDKEKQLLAEDKNQNFLNFIENAEQFVRSRRNSLLNSSDWTQMPDSPLSEDKKNEWKLYRQNLRDLPEKISDFMLYIEDTTLWPEPPQ
jgi:hypothetical protein